MTLNLSNYPIDISTKKLLFSLQLFCSSIKLDENLKFVYEKLLVSYFV